MTDPHPTTDPADRLVDRIAKLLAQAEGTTHDAEAQAYVAKAQELATTHAIDLELARRRQQERRDRGRPEPPTQVRVAVGERGRRGNRHRVLLYVAVAHPNDVLVDVARDSTWVLGYGYPSDLEVVERLWGSLAVQMTAHAQRRLAAGEHRAAGVGALTWRLSFYDGWVDRVGQRLVQARERAVAQAVQQAAERAAAGGGEDGAGPGAELVLVAKRDRVGQFHAQASQARGSWRGSGAGRTSYSSHAARAGRADADRADLGQPRVAQRGRLEA